MTDKEIYQFIDTMKEFDDSWSYEEVKKIYGRIPLDEAVQIQTQTHKRWRNILNNLLSA